MKIFLPTDVVFDTNGEKSVHPMHCIEHREVGFWYVDVSFPVEEVSQIKQDYIIIVDTQEKGEQPFRIQNVEVSNKVTCRAHHIGFDTKRYAVELSTVLGQNCPQCLAELSTNILPNHPFKFGSDILTNKSFSVIDVSLYDALTTIASEYNGTLDFDGWEVYVLSSLGTDRGLSVEYGKNLESALVVEDWDNVVTQLKPIGNNGITLTPEWLTADVSYDKPYAKIMFFYTDSVENLALVSQLYLDRYKVPRINYKVSTSFLSTNTIKNLIGNTHADLEAYTHEELEAYTHAELGGKSESEYIALGDTIQVNARQFTVLTNVISYDYNVLTHHIKTVEFGNFRPTVKNMFNNIKKEVEEATLKKAQVKIDAVNGEISLVVSDVSSLNSSVSSLNGSVSTLNGQVSQINLDLDSVEISVGKYLNGELVGTYYNFDGDAFTITNADSEVVFSADALGNLTLTGTITGSTIIGSIIKSSANADRIEFNNTTLQAFKDNYSRVELNYETMKFKTETGTDAVILKAYVNSASEDFKIMTKDNYKDYAYLYLGEAVWGNTRQASIGVADDSLKYAICSSSVDDYNGASSYLVANNNAGTEATISCESSGLLTMWSTTENYQIYINGALRGITRDANGFLKAV